ncbi:MAG: VpsF family polysaccharide biosynthesis protein [Hyphomicrobium sp.]
MRSTMTVTATQDGTVAGSDTVLALGRGLIIALLFTISPLALVQLGWQYDDTGGGPLDKLHPATWLALLLFGYQLARHGNPLTGFIRTFERHANMVPFLLGIVFMIVYATRVIGSPFTIFMETFLAPLLVFLLYVDIEGREAKYLAWLMHALLFANALLGFYEFIFSFHLTPLVVNGELITDETRSTALLGHPLANAAIVGSYVLILAIGGGRDLPPVLTLLVFAVNLASMIVFGGRAATALVLGALVLLGLKQFLDVLRGAPIRLQSLRTGLLAIPVVCLLVTGLVELGFFDMFLDRLTDDEGSASTRIAMFSIFDHVTWSELLFAPDAKHIGTWSAIYGLDYGIESFIVAFLLSFGIIATVVFIPTLVLFCIAVARALSPRGGWVLVYFFAVALTSVSLSAKSPLFATLIVMLMVLLRQKQARPGARSPVFSR